MKDKIVEITRKLKIATHDCQLNTQVAIVSLRSMNNKEALEASQRAAKNAEQIDELISSLESLTLLF